MSSTQLPQRLMPFRRRTLALGSFTAIGWAIAIAALILLAGMWIDLMTELASPLRLGWSLGVVVVAALVLITAAGRLRTHATPQHLAGRIDDAGGTGGQILSGVDLHFSDVVAQETITAQLARMAVERAAALAAAVDPRRAIPLAPLRRPAVSLACIAAAALLATFLSPRLVVTQFARFFDPFGDHPPFSRIGLRISPGDARVIYGTPLEIRVDTDGPAVERLDVIYQSDGSSTPETVPMFMEATGKWRTTIAGVVASGKYFVQGPDVRSRRYNVTVATVPVLQSVTFRITPPAYTHLGPYQGPLPQGGIAGLPSTRVEVIAQSNRPLGGGTIEIRPPGPASTRPSEVTTIAMKPAAGKPDAVIGSFELRLAGRMELRITDTASQDSLDRFVAPIAILVDERPMVRVIQPLPTSFATPRSVLPVEIAAEDDYGIAGMQLYRSLNDSRGLPVDLPVPESQPTRLVVNSALPLAEYGLHPGDVIKLFARVIDNDPAGPKGAESPVTTVRIISEQDYEEMLLARQGMDVLQSKYEEARRHLESARSEIDKLEKKLEKMDPNSDEAKKIAEEIAKLADQLAEHANAVDELAKHDLPFDIDKAMKKELEKLANELSKSAKAAAGLGKQSGLNPDKAREALEKLRKALEEKQEDFDKNVTLPMELLAKVFALLQDEARFIRIYEEQRDLEQRLASLKDKTGADDPSVKPRMRDFEARQAELRNDLRDLLDDIEKHAAELPDDPAVNGLRDTAKEIARRVRESGAQDEMTSAQEGLADFSGARGYRHAKAAADILATFISKCEGFGDAAGQCLKFNPKLSSALGNTLQQLLAASGLNAKAGQGGYSASRNTAQNVGVYGHLPTHSAASRSGNANGPAGSTTSSNPDAPPRGAGTASARNPLAGQGDVPAPAAYKRRVGAYFQRVADELSQP
ncbi:MAG: hypothetical protein ACHRHE_04140 [Tepidisphaerales bacterium]